MTTNRIFMDAQEVADALGTSKAYAYKLIQRLNEEMTGKGYITIPGKLNRSYFYEKVYSSGVNDYASLQR